MLPRTGYEEPMNSILVILLSFKFKGFLLCIICHSLSSDILIYDFQFEGEETDGTKACLFILFESC